MHISRLSIRNFRNFGPGGFNINLKPTTLIVGENNIGKTNLLLAMSLILNHDYVAATTRSLQLEDFNYSAVQDYQNKLADPLIQWSEIDFPAIVVSLTMTDFTDDQRSIVGDWFSKDDFSEASLTYSYQLRGGFNREKWISEQRARIEQHKQAGSTVVSTLPIGDYRSSIVGGKGLVECEAHLLRMLRLEILDAMRDAKRELTSGEGRILYRVLKQAVSGSYLDVEDQLLALQKAIRDNAALGGLKGEIATLLEKVSLVGKASDNSVDFRFFSPDADDLLAKIALVYGSDPVPVERNGLGRNNLLFVGLLISQLCKPSEPKGSERHVGFRVIGVEEPEAHLHPHLQEHLATNLELLRAEQDSQLQLLVTSHSTHITSKIDLSNTVVVYRDDEAAQLRSHYVLEGLVGAAGTKTKRFLSLYLDATKSKMLFARRLILVEGIAEQTLLPQLFKRVYDQTLESIGCTVVNVQGLAFRPFLEVVRNGYFLRCVVITDLDSDIGDGERGEQLATDYKDVSGISVHITTQSTFEKDLIAANLRTECREVLWEALESTRPRSGPKLKAELSGVVDLQKFFDLIADYKASFAFNLSGIIKDKDRKFDPPAYLAEAFKFLKEEG